MGDKVLDCMADGECGDPLYDEDDDDLSAYSIVDWNLGRVQRTRLSSQFAFQGFVTKESSFRNVCTFPEVGTFQRKITL